MQNMINWKETLKKLEKENEQLRILAQTDQLTGLYNRMTTQQRIDQALEQKRMGTLVLMDIDDFKGCNDRFGHLNGDRILKKVAEVCRSFLLPDDIAGRVGGDEFVLFFTEGQVLGGLSETVCALERRLRQIGLIPGEGTPFLSPSASHTPKAPMIIFPFSGGRTKPFWIPRPVKKIGYSPATYHKRLDILLHQMESTG